MRQKAILDQAIPEDWSIAKRAQKDLDATWTQKHGKSYFGYKASASVERGCREQVDPNLRDQHRVTGHETPVRIFTVSCIKCASSTKTIQSFFN